MSPLEGGRSCSDRSEKGLCRMIADLHCAYIKERKNNLILCSISVYILLYSNVLAQINYIMQYKA